MVSVRKRGHELKRAYDEGLSLTGMKNPVFECKKRTSIWVQREGEKESVLRRMCGVCPRGGDSKGGRGREGERGLSMRSRKLL